MTKYILWGLKGLMSVAFLGAGAAKLVQAAPLIESMERLGYPLYLLTILGVAYVAGVVGLWQPVSKAVREWAYAGFGIAMTGAFASHILGGDPLGAAIPSLVLLALVVASYVLDKRAD